jgi:dihydroorotate dehydrogenase (fumarate)
MANLTTNYLGILIRNPIIIASSGLTSSVEKIIELEKQGAGAIVLKSLFEEQIMYEAGISLNSRKEFPQITEYMLQYLKNNSVESYLQLIKLATQEVPIPIIASINCYSIDNWLDFAQRIEKAGADAIEINLYFVPVEKEMSSLELEKDYYELVLKLSRKISIPISVKLGPNFTNLPGLVNQLYNSGAGGVVLFNRFYEPDIDIHELTFKQSDVLSLPSDMKSSLRWISLVSSLNKHIDVAASTGIHSSESIIKQILAGAKATQLCSVLYKNDLTRIGIFLDDIQKWMDKKGFMGIDDFRGIMSYDKIPDPSIYERTQFMRYFSNFQGLE